MDWCRLTTNYYLDPALARAGEAAEVLFLRCIAYSGAVESHGRIPTALLPMLTPTKTKARLDALLRENLVLRDGADIVIRSWQIHQEALDSEAERRKKWRDKKAKQRAEARTVPLDVPGTVPGTCPPTSKGRPQLIEEEVEEEKKTSSSSSRAKRGTPAPDLFPITEAMSDWGRDHAPLVADPKGETQRFLDYHRAKGSRFIDWTAAWRNWMGNAQKYALERGAKQPGAYPAGFEWLENM